MAKVTREHKVGQIVLQAYADHTNLRLTTGEFMAKVREAVRDTAK